MKVAWIFPCHERCGIRFYAEKYVAALAESVEVSCFDSADYFADPAGFLSKINTCDLIHIQYEPSFFFYNKSDFYKKLCSALTPPLVVSLHEVYPAFPDVFPRDALDGPGVISLVKRWRYDFRHPVQTAYRRHAAHSFFARRVLVHYDFQSAILREQGVRSELLAVLPLPVTMLPNAAVTFWPDRTLPLYLAATGFINPHYDYDLLLSSLERLTIPWRFTWIGGIRRKEDAPLLQKLDQSIAARCWRERFRITGWVPDRERDDILASSDIVCALFSVRSSSASLAAALGALRCIVATTLPLTGELASKHGVLRCVPHTPDGVAAGIQEIINNGEFRATLQNNVARYRETTTYEAVTAQLIDIYNKLAE